MQQNMQPNMQQIYRHFQELTLQVLIQYIYGPQTFIVVLVNAMLDYKMRRMFSKFQGAKCFWIYFQWLHMTSLQRTDKVL